MNKKEIINKLKKVLNSIDLTITSLNQSLNNREFAKVVSVTKRGETDLMELKMLLAGLKKIELNDDEKKEFSKSLIPMKKKVREMSLVSDTNAIFYSSFLNILNSILSINYKNNGQMAFNIKNNKISQSV